MMYRTSSREKWIRALGALALVLGFCIAPRSAMAGPTSAPATESVQYRGLGGGGGPPAGVSEDLLKVYIQQVKQTPIYHMARLLPPDVVKKAARQWEKEFDLQLIINEEGGGGFGLPRGVFWRGLTWLDSLPLPDGKFAALMTGEKDAEPQLLISGRATRMGERSGDYYSVAPRQIAELDFACVWTVTVVDPLNTTLERFVAHNEPLNGLLQRLCAAGKATCSYRQDFVEQARITVDLRDKSVLTCLKVLAATAGGKVLFMLPDGTIVPDIALNWSVSPDDIAKSLKEAPTTTEQALEILKKVVAVNFRKVLDDRPMMILQVPAVKD